MGVFYRYDDLFQLNSYSAFDGAIMKKWFQGGPEVDKVLIYNRT